MEINGIEFTPFYRAGEGDGFTARIGEGFALINRENDGDDWFAVRAWDYASDFERKSEESFVIFPNYFFDCDTMEEVAGKLREIF